MGLQQQRQLLYIQLIEQNTSTGNIVIIFMISEAAELFESVIYLL